MSCSPPYLGELSPERCALLLCDVQERFGAEHFPAVAENARRLAAAARLLQVPIIATEQYPKVNIKIIPYSISVVLL